MFGINKAQDHIDELANDILLEIAIDLFDDLVSESLQDFFPLPGHSLVFEYIMYPQQRKFLATKFLEDGYVVSLAETVHGGYQATIEAWSSTTTNEETVFCSPKDWFQLVNKRATEYIFLSLCETLSTDNNARGYLEGYLSFRVGTEGEDKEPDFWFRFRVFEHAIKWITATTAFNATLEKDGRYMDFPRKTLEHEVECAQDKQNAVLFSSVVHVARTASMWSDLPLTALEIVIEFVVGKKKPCYIVSNAAVGEVNGKYVFHKVVDSTIKNYRNVMYVKHPTPEQQPLYLMRARLRNKGLVWGITPLDNAKEFTRPEQALCWSKMKIVEGEWYVSATKAYDRNISVTVVYE